ncbi:MAG: HAD family phosphatase [Deltaproteobacteria bacterium]|nr:HAD family phosphatase [Deltaproteobacteria bacterium]
MKYKAAIFDMDGLLLDTERIFLDAFINTCAELDYKFEMPLFISIIGTNSVRTKDILTEGFGRGYNHDMFREVWIKNVEAYLSTNSIPIKEGALNLLDKISSVPMPMAVATSTRYHDAVNTLKSTGIIDYFKFIVGGDHVTNSKPDPEIYLKAADKLDVDPKECIVFEDSENGVKSAHAAGMHVIQVPDLVTPSDEIKALGHRIYDSLNMVTGDFELIFTGFHGPASA